MFNLRLIVLLIKMDIPQAGMKFPNLKEVESFMKKEAYVFV